MILALIYNPKLGPWRKCFANGRHQVAWFNLPNKYVKLCLGKKNSLTTIKINILQTFPKLFYKSSKMENEARHNLEYPKMMKAESKKKSKSPKQVSLLGLLG